MDRPSRKVWHADEIEPGLLVPKILSNRESIRNKLGSEKMDDGVHQLIVKPFVVQYPIMFATQAEPCVRSELFRIFIEKSLEEKHAGVERKALAT